ncbi:CBS domain-containing protein [bacterium]|nr:CBS domain-containing protein [bacterium]
MKKFKASDIMTKEIFSVQPDMTVKAVAQFFLQNNISGAPVLDDHAALVGIVTEGDVIFRDATVHAPTMITLFDAIIYLEGTQKHEQELKKIIGGKVEDIMSKDVVTISPEADLQEMATIMHEKKKHLLPVVESGKVVGIVGKADMVRAIIQEE